METKEKQAWIWTSEQLMKFEIWKPKLQKINDEVNELYSLFYESIPYFWVKASEIYTPLIEVLDELIKLDDNVYKKITFKEAEKKFLVTLEKNTAWTNFIHQREIMASIIVATKKAEEKRKEEARDIETIEKDVREVLSDKEYMEDFIGGMNKTFNYMFGILESLEMKLSLNPSNLKIYKKLFIIHFINDIVKLSFVKNVEQDLIQIETKKLSLEELFIETLACLMKNSFIADILSSNNEGFKFMDIYQAHLSSTLDTMVRLIIELSSKNIEPENINKEHFIIDIFDCSFEHKPITKEEIKKPQ